MTEDLRWMWVMILGLFLVGTAEASHPMVPTILCAAMLAIAFRLDELFRRH
jgi:hypothetical protein